METSNKKARGIILKVENNIKRVWFSVDTSDETKFEECYKRIDEIGEGISDLRTLVEVVVKEFSANGFERIKM